jgi:uncharacterized protein YndB with AHSA1/START domain
VKSAPPTHLNTAGTGVTTLELPGDREVVVRRELAGPRRLVWEAWTSPEHLPHWMLGPPGWTMPVCEMDLRPGGSWRIVWRHPHEQELVMTGTYREVVPPERVVNTESWGPEWPETVNTVTFAEESPGRTTVTLHILYPTPEARDAALKTGMTEGMEATFRRLDDYLPRLTTA